MKNLKLKVLVVTLAVCLLAIGSLGTLAWFNASDEVTNQFLIADSEDDADKIFSVDVWEKADPSSNEKLDSIVYPDILPGDDLYKEVNIENTGYYAQYIRATVTVSGASVWQSIFGEIYFDLDELVEGLNGDFNVDRIVYNADEDTMTYVYYYNGVLEAGDVVTLFTNVLIPDDMDQYDAAALSGEFNIGVKADAVQTENVGDDAIEAFTTVGMYEDAGNYTIASSAIALDKLAALVNAGMSFEGEIITLTGDIDLAGVQIASIGTEESPFKGTFDGANCTISNMTTDMGLFGYLGEGATVKNVNFENVNVSGTYAAVVAYYAEKATFENIQVLSGSINVDYYGAAIVFEAYEITINDCTNYVDVVAGYSASGIGAWVYDSTVNNCANYGDITGANRAGGICANFSGSMSNCTNDGDVTSTGNGAAGGIVGITGGAITIEGCTNNGDVTTTANNVNASAAGIVGQVPGNKGCVIKSCANNGNITAENSHAAGIVVSLYGSTTVDTCTNSGVITGTKGAAELAAAKGVFSGKNTIQ